MDFGSRRSRTFERVTVSAGEVDRRVREMVCSENDRDIGHLVASKTHDPPSIEGQQART